MDRFQKLLTVGKELLDSRRPPPSNVIGDDRVDHELAAGWAVSAQNAIDESCGASSAYAVRFREATVDPITYSNALRAYGILKAAAADLPSREIASTEPVASPPQAKPSQYKLPRFQLGVLTGAGIGWLLCLRRAEIAAAFSSADGIRAGTTALCLALILGGVICGNLFSSSVHEHGWIEPFRRAPVRSAVYLVVALAGVICTLKAASFL